jgi:hypothetical protein
MDFKNWLENTQVIEESSLVDLYQSTISAFPNCNKRQNSIDEIVINKLYWLPFVGMKTLHVKGIALNKENGHEYSPQIVFKDVKFHHSDDVSKLIEITDNKGDSFFIEKLSYHNTQILVRCSCADFAWRFNYADHLSHDLQGKKRKKYEALYRPGSANIENAKGVCKHILKLIHVLGKSYLII